jgi:phospholipase/carboxylesterase
MSLLPFETVLTAPNPEFSIIWLHGLGADGHDFVSLVPELQLPDNLRIKFIFPHAPVRAVTLNNGMQMRAWYDLLSLDRGKTADEADILTTVSQINALIDQEINSGTAADKIILAGFSQGGVIALQCGLRYPKRLAGIMALSTYLPFDENTFKQMSSVQKGLDIFAAHGTHDPVIPFLSWQDYVPKLQAQEFVVDAHEYPMEHSLCLEEIKAISNWIQKVFT